MNELAEMNEILSGDERISEVDVLLNPAGHSFNESCILAPIFQTVGLLREFGRMYSEGCTVLTYIQLLYQDSSDLCILENLKLKLTS